MYDKPIELLLSLLLTLNAVDSIENFHICRPFFATIDAVVKIKF